ncbi:hypothetical protein MTR_3g069850 [Medicago truncatula]|uniref:Uncharacterized protein n=1 Tax=Medicago truncatula TaxID=3880 RepID=G7JAL5_MEDTR|nr:hypothetical protein MTR_3g069850 [Medicago truncatula]
MTSKTPYCFHDCRLTPQTNTSLFGVFCPHSHACRKTSRQVTHPKIAPSQARLTVEFLWNDPIPARPQDPSHSDVIQFCLEACQESDHSPPSSASGDTCPLSGGVTKNIRRLVKTLGISRMKIQEVSKDFKEGEIMFPGPKTTYMKAKAQNDRKTEKKGSGRTHMRLGNIPCT